MVKDGVVVSPPVLYSIQGKAANNIVWRTRIAALPREAFKEEDREKDTVSQSRAETKRRSLEMICAAFDEEEMPGAQRSPRSSSKQMSPRNIPRSPRRHNNLTTND